MTEEKKSTGRLTLDELKVLIGYNQSESDLGPFRGQALARVHTLDNEVEAQVIKQGLEQENIPCLIQSHKDTAYDGLFTPSKGWGEVITREQDANRACDTIRNLLDAWVAETED
jgi:hypothetical protein